VMPKLRELEITRAECLRRCKREAQANTEKDKEAACTSRVHSDVVEFSIFDPAVFAAKQAESEKLYKECIKRCPPDQTGAG
jgi:hypothetical protein